MVILSNKYLIRCYICYQFCIMCIILTLNVWLDPCHGREVVDGLNVVDIFSINVNSQSTFYRIKRFQQPDENSHLNQCRKF